MMSAAVRSRVRRTLVRSQGGRLCNINTSFPTIIRLTDPTRVYLAVRNDSATQTLSIGFGTAGSSNTPGSLPDSVLPGQEWVASGLDSRPVFARFPTTVDAVFVTVVTAV